MAANDVYMITFKLQAAAQIIENVYFYEATSSSAGANALELRLAFETAVSPLISGILSNTTQFIGYDIVNLFNNADFLNFLYDSTIIGSRTGEPMPTFVGVKFLSSKPTSSQQPARKSYGVISQDDVDGNQVLLGGSFEDALIALALQLAMPLLGSSSRQYDPVIVKRIPYITDKGNKAYRLPTGLGESTTFPAIGWGFKTELKPQVTRAIGRGI